jgi:hypothetical protein
MDQLARMHEELKELILLLAGETAKPMADMAAVSAIRMKLTRVSRCRATLLEDMFTAACTNGRSPDRALTNIVMDARKARLASGAHICKWTLRAIEADWTGYCRDSAQMRSLMLRQIENEANALELRSHESSGAVGQVARLAA